MIPIQMKSNPEYISQRKPIYLAMENYPNIRIFKLCDNHSDHLWTHSMQAKFHSQNWSLVGYSPRGRKESAMAEQLLLAVR